MKRIYKEVTADRGWAKYCNASDNWATYILTSAYAKDTYNDYVRRYDRAPTAKWYNRHFQFERVN